MRPFRRVAGAHREPPKGEARKRDADVREALSVLSPCVLLAIARLCSAACLSVWSPLCVPGLAQPAKHCLQTEDSLGVASNASNAELSGLPHIVLFEEPFA